jgi:CBS domain containing-hemolysin-like protein
LEAVLLSVTPSFINTKLLKGGKMGKDLETLKGDIDKPLSAILTLNTIAHTVGAIGVGAQANIIFKGEDDFLGISAESIVAGIMTLLILILSEIIPKTLGANYWRSLIGFTIKTIKGMMIVLAPFVWLSQLITKSWKKKDVGSVFSRADIMAMTNVSEEYGAIKKSESKVIQNLLNMNALTVHDIMTPMTVMVMADENQTLQEFYDKHEKFVYSRIPIYKDRSDNITGFFLKDDLLESLLNGKKNAQLSSLKRAVSFVSEKTVLLELLDQLGDNKEHISVVNDVYGSVVGIVTMEDVLETVLGHEIMDESDDISDLQAYARKKWEERTKRKGNI